MTHQCVLEVVEGLERLAANELTDLFPKVQIHGYEADASSELLFTYKGRLGSLAQLRLAHAVYLRESFDIPRPKALLGDSHWRRFREQIATVMALSSRGAFKTFNVSAAGSDSSVMQRIRQMIADETGLQDQEKGDLAIRLRPSSNGGWETLVRLFPRPLATRAWRVCNYEAALNATAAYAMALLTEPTPEDVVVNLGSGSGSLLIERAALCPARQLIGVDHDPSLLACAAQNIHASEITSIRLLRGDMRSLPLPNQSADVLMADLPFGQNVGSHEDNVALYPAIFAEAARIARPAARFTVITHEIRLIEGLLSANRDWAVEKTLRITLRGLHPRIYVLRRANQTI
ncbi:MAG: methyltransferase domain-containing protein [Anaerolineae bacterium]